MSVALIGMRTIFVPAGGGHNSAFLLTDRLLVDVQASVRITPVPMRAAPVISKPLATGLNVQVLVRENNVDQALRALKKKMQREGIFREMKLRGHYEKPSEKRAREKAEAVRRARKLVRKRLQREGLLPATKAKAPARGAR